MIIERFVNEIKLTDAVIHRYSSIYGDVVAYSPAIFGGFYIYTKVDFGRQLVFI